MKTYIVDAFTALPFKGNPAGICFPLNAISDEKMQSIAAELNLSETAFVTQKESEESTRFSIRYFTPTVEIPFCGHATLATAKVIFSIYSDYHEITIKTAHGLKIGIRKSGDYIQMDLPLYAPVLAQPEPEMLTALELDSFVYYGISKESGKGFLVVENAEIVRKLQPNFVELAKTGAGAIRGLIVTATSDVPEYDFISRCFCPWIGISEDPVTGVAHTVLAHYWRKQLQKDILSAYQASHRGGALQIHVRSETNMQVSGQAVIVFVGDFIAG